MDMEIRWYVGNKSLRICVRREVSVCVSLKSSQMGALFGISLFLTLPLQGQERLHLYDSLSLLSTYSDTYIEYKTYLSPGFLFIMYHTFLFALLHSESSFSLFTVHYGAIQSWIQTVVARMPMGGRWWIQLAGLNVVFCSIWSVHLWHLHESSH